MSCIRIAIHNAMHGNLKAAMQSSPLLCVTIQYYVIFYISNISVVSMLCYAFQSVMPQCNPAQFYVLQPQAKLKNWMPWSTQLTDCEATQLIKINCNYISSSDVLTLNLCNQIEVQFKEIKVSIQLKIARQRRAINLGYTWILNRYRYTHQHFIVR